jgi:hypothetical protein
MKKTLIALAIAGVTATGIGAPVASAAPCPGLPALGSICTPRNDDTMKPYEGKKEPRKAWSIGDDGHPPIRFGGGGAGKTGPKSAGNPSA